MLPAESTQAAGGRTLCTIMPPALPGSVPAYSPPAGRECVVQPGPGEGWSAARGAW